MPPLPDPVEAPQVSSGTCPRCGGAARRVRRHAIDRWLSLWEPVVRFRCGSATCAWQGRIRRADLPPRGLAERAYVPHRMLDPALGAVIRE